jgi:hypothetical protein
VREYAFTLIIRNFDSCLTNIEIYVSFACQLKDLLEAPNNDDEEPVRFDEM